MTQFFRAVAVSAALVAGVAALPMTAVAQGKNFSAKVADQPAGIYAVDPSHARLYAKVKHMGLANYVMILNKVDATVTLDPAAAEKSTLSMNVDPNGVWTGLPDFDKKIATSFFGGTPIQFKSTALKAVDEARGVLSGDLTLNSVTKPVTFDVAFTGGGLNFGGKPTLGFEAKGTIMRSDFKVAPQLPNTVVSDKVEVIFEGEFNKQ